LGSAGAIEPSRERKGESYYFWIGTHEEYNGFKS
jgi:hypothetical protein